MTELDVDVLPRDPEMWGVDLETVDDQAATDVYPDGLPPEQQRRLGGALQRDFQPCREAPRGTSPVTLWGVTDRTSSLNNFRSADRVNYPLLFDREGSQAGARRSGPSAARR